MAHHTSHRTLASCADTGLVPDHLGTGGDGAALGYFRGETLTTTFA